MKKKYHYRVTVGNMFKQRYATSRGNAARIVFRELIAEGYLKNQPLSSDGGGWEDVLIECIGGPR
jgi:hypothetical protein